MHPTMKPSIRSGSLAMEAAKSLLCAMLQKACSRSISIVWFVKKFGFIVDAMKGCPVVCIILFGPIIDGPYGLEFHGWMWNDSSLLQQSTQCPQEDQD